MSLRLLDLGRIRLAQSSCTAHQLTRCFSSASVTQKEAPAASTSQSTEAPEPKLDKSKKGPALPSSCPAGTMLSGLSLYKDRPDPVALPDDQYPDWLWSILDDASASTSPSGVVLESTAGMSKGEARAAQKRNLRAVRAAQRGKGKETEGSGKAGGAGAGAGMNAVGAASEGVVGAPVGEAERAAGLAAVAVEGASASSVEAEKVAKKLLRQASREKIKARNFLGKR